jgi:hypothetical protein
VGSQVQELKFYAWDQFFGQILPHDHFAVFVINCRFALGLFSQSSDTSLHVVAENPFRWLNVRPDNRHYFLDSIGESVYVTTVRHSDSAAVKLRTFAIGNNGLF